MIVAALLIAWLALNALLGAWFLWRYRADKRHLQAAKAELEARASRRDEQAARAALRPHTGNVAPAPIHPPANGNK